jgi:hypothetical protein
MKKCYCHTCKKPVDITHNIHHEIEVESERENYGISEQEN